jgi:hypothetical protein
MNTCAHIWPDELEPDTPCTSCGLNYAEWSQQEAEWSHDEKAEQ